MTCIHDFQVGNERKKIFIKITIGTANLFKVSKQNYVRN